MCVHCYSWNHALLFNDGKFGDELVPLPDFCIAAARAACSAHSSVMVKVSLVRPLFVDSQSLAECSALVCGKEHVYSRVPQVSVPVFLLQRMDGWICQLVIPF